MPTTKDPEVNVEQARTQEEQKTHFNAAHKILLLYLGIFALTIDEIEKLVSRLIERGEIAEQDGRKLLHKVTIRRIEEAHEGENGNYSQTKKAGNRVPLASKTDVDALNEKIARLSVQIDEFNQ